MYKTSSALKLFLISCLVVTLTACASKFPSPVSQSQPNASPSAKEIFDRTFKIHGGNALKDLNNVNVSLSGQWKTLIKKIQPLVTDFNYRVDSEERLFPNQGGYVAFYTGPGGNKKVVRTPDSIDVYYNGVASTDPEVLSSTALTADAFLLFLLGPLSLADWQDKFTRLTDITNQGKTYYRLHLYRTPGFGFSESDQVVLWIDPDTDRTHMIQITLEGHSTTKGAHVEVEFLDYIQYGDYLLPSQFFERVNAPIAIDAHAWHLTGLDINRGTYIENYHGPSGNLFNNKPAEQIAD